MVPYGYTTQQRILKEMSEKGLPEEEASGLLLNRLQSPKSSILTRKRPRFVNRIFETFIETNSLRKTANFLNSLGIKLDTVRPGPWLRSIRFLLTRSVWENLLWEDKDGYRDRKLKNVNREDWKEVLGQHQPIVSEKLHNQVLKILKSGSRKPTRARHEYLLSGLLRCGKCGGSMYGATLQGRSRKNI